MGFRSGVCRLFCGVAGCNGGRERDRLQVADTGVRRPLLPSNGKGSGLGRSLRDHTLLTDHPGAVLLALRLSHDSHAVGNLLPDTFSKTTIAHGQARALRARDARARVAARHANPELPPAGTGAAHREPRLLMSAHVESCRTWVIDHRVDAATCERLGDARQLADARSEAVGALIVGSRCDPETLIAAGSDFVKIVDFGAFVNFFGKRDGLVHVSQIENRRLNHPSDVLKEGQEVWVKLLGFDDRGKVRLAMKMVDQETGKEVAEEAKE